MSTAFKLRQDNFDNLAASLIALQRDYEALSATDRAGRQKFRDIVIAGKTKARWASKRAKTEAKRAQKDEMAAWMLTWLENPPVFEAWVAQRLRAMKPSTSSPSP